MGRLIFQKYDANLAWEHRVKFLAPNHAFKTTFKRHGPFVFSEHKDAELAWVLNGQVSGPKPCF